MMDTDPIIEPLEELQSEIVRFKAHIREWELSQKGPSLGATVAEILHENERLRAALLLCYENVTKRDK